MTWPQDPNGDLAPILQASLDECRRRHPSGKAVGSVKTELTAADRCDRCGAAAGFRLRKQDLHLDFCVHHYRKNTEAMKKDGWEVACQRSAG